MFGICLSKIWLSLAQMSDLVIGHDGDRNQNSIGKKKQNRSQKSQTEISFLKGPTKGPKFHLLNAFFKTHKKKKITGTRFNLKFYEKCNLKGIKLKKEKELLFEENERLRIENTSLTASLDSTSIQLYETKLFSDALLDQNKTLTDVVKNASYLQVLGLDAVGVIERSSGKLIPTERARRSDKLKVCFMIAKNDLVESGDMELYVQVIDPKNNVLGLNNELVFNEDVLNYSLISSFNYENNNLDICEYISSDEKFETGNYTVNIFNKNTLLSSTSLTLK